MDKALNYINNIWAHQGFQKYFKNTGWMLTARIISFATSFFTVAIVARYLGPENLGKLDYAQSFVVILSVFASLGIDQILYRDLVTANKERDTLIGTAIFSKLVLGSIAFLISVSISLVINDEILLTALVAIISLNFLVNPIGTVGILFNAKVKAKYKSQITIFLAFFIPALKLLVIWFNQGILFFAAIILIETLISVTWSTYIYITKFNGKPSKWRFNFNLLKKVLKDSWPLFLASLSGYIYSRMDQVMLLHYLNPKSVGIYGVAVKLTEIWTFIPGMIIGSLFPAIMNAKKVNFGSYIKRFKTLSFSTLGVTALVAAPLYILAPFVVHIIFGKEFTESVPVLHIYVWVSFGITLIALLHHYLLAENLGKIFLYISIIGAIVNILLNVMLIPSFGVYGAAYSTLISYFVAAFSILLFKKSRNDILRIFKS
jgi:O-antigen/teichoic acid export membrane protein